MSNLLLGIILGAWSGISMVLNLSGVGVRTTLITGVIAGLCVGDVNMGFQIGSICMLMSIGFYTYGGATIPDYITGTMFGTVIAVKTGSYDAGLVTAEALAVLMSEMDILGRATTTVFQHLAEGALAENSISKFETFTILGTLPWILSRLIPVLLGMIMIDHIADLVNFANTVLWVKNGMAVVGGILPAVGFALLLSYMDLKKYWPYLIIGFVLFAYAGMGTIALALVGAALAGIVVFGGAK